MPTSQDNSNSEGRGHLQKRRRTSGRSGMYQRKRAVTACETCRLRKTKCDNLRPKCGFCQRSGSHCTFPDASSSSDWSTFDPASLTILNRLDHVVSLLESRPPGAAPTPIITVSDLPGCYTTSPESAIRQPLNTAPTLGLPNELDDESTEADVFWAIDNPSYPSAINNCEGILRWPVLQDIASGVHSFVLESEGETSTIGSERSGKGIIHDDCIVHLSRKFLALVHIKNPILDVAEFNVMVKDLAENGLRWDGSSCLVLIACGLGCLAEPFNIDGNMENTPSSCGQPSDPACVARDAAMSYYLSAKKRIGLLHPSLLYLQCLFLLGVYEMYCFKPMQAWFYFNRACVDLRNVLWARDQRQATDDPETMRKTRRLEQRLYWSCMKSEFELRCEIPLPVSDITHCRNLDMFPSPPPELTSPTSQREAQSISEELFVADEEKSWFYYLAEISFRRLMNRAMAAMGSQREQGWTHDIRETIKQCEDFSEQMNAWSSHIPPQIDWNDSKLANDEIAYLVRNRELHIREWIHRPFLYYIIHQPPGDPYYTQALDLAQICLELCVEHLLQTSQHHRHHGTWYVARAAMARGLLIFAAAKSGKIRLPERSGEALVMARRTLEKWSTEALDLKRALATWDKVEATIEI